MSIWIGWKGNFLSLFIACLRGVFAKASLNQQRRAAKDMPQSRFLPRMGELGEDNVQQNLRFNPSGAKFVRLAGLKPRQRAPKGLLVFQWLGISTDEITRMKQAPDPWMENRFPLIDDLRMSRADCLAWFNRHYPERSLPRSSCIGCPFHRDAEWREMRQHDPEAFADAVFIDSQIRSGAGACLRGMKQTQFMHRSRKPLAEVDFSTLEDRGQFAFGFANECDGICGL